MIPIKAILGFDDTDKGFMPSHQYQRKKIYDIICQLTQVTYGLPKKKLYHWRY